MTHLRRSALIQHELTLPNQNNDEIKEHYDFSLNDQLGSGAFSVVVKGTHKKTNEVYAIKCVDKGQTARDEMFAELEVMSRLSHANVVNFKEVFDDEEHYYVILELITGGELFDRIIELKRYSEKDASFVMYQALSGIKHMHDKNLVHRDLKPENLLLSSKEPDAIVKVADFGFATTCLSSHDLDEMVGTPPYMAPEISALRTLESSYGKPVDIWAMGVVLYILLSGIHPFQIDDEDQMLDNIQAGKFQWMGSNWTKVSPEAKDLIKHMMTLNPSDRYTVDECLSHSWMQGNVGSEDLGGVAEEIKRYQARKRFKAAILGVVAANKMKFMLERLKQERAKRATAHVNKITLKIIQGKDLAAKDNNGKSDPFCKIVYGTHKSKTKIKKKTLAPHWDEPPIILPYKENCNLLTVECWDWDRIGSDDFMGEFTVDLSELPVNEELTRWFSLQPHNGKNKKKKTENVTGSIQAAFLILADVKN